MLNDFLLLKHLFQSSKVGDIFLIRFQVESVRRLELFVGREYICSSHTMDVQKERVSLVLDFQKRKIIIDLDRFFNREISKLEEGSLVHLESKEIQLCVFLC
ncbi:MAG: hypothetical protein B7Z80_00925 [Rhodospirillales bacterium 20-64-7]|nr:MAG: hypothetical protein B7Z80_00925 [Rhodospirillales bacterium 20-64-7]